MSLTVLLAAGGTGGHLFPAQALASELTARGHVVDLVTDPRAERYADRFEARRVYIVRSATIAGRSPVALARTFLRLGTGFLAALRIVRRVRPQVTVGFGGYPTLPPLFAARAMRVPTVVHEANAVIGRANRLLARFSSVATSFPEVAGLAAPAGRTRQTGLPVRPAVLAAAGRPYPDASAAGGRLRLMVFGGSQGARVFADRVPPAVALLAEPLRARLDIVQQCRPEDLARVGAAYADAGVPAELADFFADLPERIAASHLVIARAGASTVAELAAIGRPAILVPLPHALDQDQAANAAALQAVGGAWRIDEAGLTAERLARELTVRLSDPAGLADAARAAQALAAPDAAARLAAFVEQVAARRMPHEEARP